MIQINDPNTTVKQKRAVQVLRVLGFSCFFNPFILSIPLKLLMVERVLKWERTFPLREYSFF